MALFLNGYYDSLGFAMWLLVTVVYIFCNCEWMPPSGFCGSRTGHRCLIQKHCLFFDCNNTYNKLLCLFLHSLCKFSLVMLLNRCLARFMMGWTLVESMKGVRERGVVLGSAERRLLPELCLISRFGRALFSINSSHFFSSFFEDSLFWVAWKDAWGTISHPAYILSLERGSKNV